MHAKRRLLAAATIAALMGPGLAVAQHEHEGEQREGAPPQHPVVRPPAKPLVAPHFPPPGAKPFVAPHGPPSGAVVVPPHPGPGAIPAAGQFSYRGRMIERVHRDPFVYPPGWAYRRWAIGAVLPPVFLVPAYFYLDWAELGLTPPPMGDQWVRYGPDLLLVDTGTGAIVEVIYDVFY
jgi:hypothetical protein